MTIQRGEPWGVEVPAPPGLVPVHSDVELAESDPATPVALAGGDLFASLGSPPLRDPMLRVEIDVLAVTLDGERTVPAVAHVVMRRSWWRGWVVAVMNVDQLGPWNVAPRAHPNDGVFDVVEVAPEMRPRERLAARRRLATGTHVPHPHIATGRYDHHEWRFERPQQVWIDGRRIGQARHVEIHLTPDAREIHL